VPQRAQRIIRPPASNASDDGLAGAAQWGQAVAIGWRLRANHSREARSELVNDLETMTAGLAAPLRPIAPTGWPDR
jgi:hypothetical protein